MKSAIIKVTRSEMNKALELVGSTAREIGYSDDIVQKTRLMTEELIAGNHTIIDDLDASLWVETNDRNMEIHLKLAGALSSSTRKKLAEISHSRCKEPLKGISSRISAFFSDTFMDNTDGYVPVFMVDTSNQYNIFGPYSLVDHHQQKHADDYEGMDEADKNAMIGQADDVTVCAFPDHAELVVVEKLPGVKEKSSA